MPQISLDAIRSVAPDIRQHNLIEWFRGGAPIAAAPDWARRALTPLLAAAGFDEAMPIHLHQHESGAGVTLYQEPNEPHGQTHRAAGTNSEKV